MVRFPYKTSYSCLTTPHMLVKNHKISLNEERKAENWKNLFIVIIMCNRSSICDRYLVTYLSLVNFQCYLVRYVKIYSGRCDDWVDQLIELAWEWTNVLKRFAAKKCVNFLYIYVLLAMLLAHNGFIRFYDSFEDYF